MTIFYIVKTQEESIDIENKNEQKNIPKKTRGVWYWEGSDFSRRSAQRRAINYKCAWRGLQR